MGKNEIHFMGFLANFDDINSSILNLKLKHGFEIRCDSLQKISQLVSILDNTSCDTAQIKLINAGINSYVTTPDGDGDRFVYYIYNSVNDEIHKNHVYLLHFINLMRLFKEGDVSMPLEYQFYYKNGVPTVSSMGEDTAIRVSRNRFSIFDEELPKLQEFIRLIQLPFKKKFLKLAFDNYQLSYDVNYPSLQFLTLTNCMEVLFSPSDRDELRFRVSRNLAILLGKNKDDSEKIFKKMREFYDKRSKIVHSGEANVTKNDVLTLRSYARESIKKFYRTNKERNELLKLLDYSGFGQPPK